MDIPRTHRERNDFPIEYGEKLRSHQAVKL
jgi:hypothetical protein